MFFIYGTKELPAFNIPLLSDYYRITSINNRSLQSFYINNLSISENSTFYPINYDFQSLSPQNAEMDINGEIDLNLSYGTTFPLKRGITVGQGSAGINSGLKYDLIEKILMEGSINDRFFVEFDYDSTRSEKGIAEEKNTYSFEYRGKDEEFIKQVTLGNKYFKIHDSRYIKIDEGNQDSFALRFLAGKGNFDFEGLLRYNVAFKGEKHFKGLKQHIDMKTMDVDYIKAQYFFLPDKNIDENTLLLYKSSSVSADIIIDNKNFKLLTRNVDYTFDNSTGNIDLSEALRDNEELVAYYVKGGVSVGDSSLGESAIIDTDGVRKDFNSSAFPDYFDSNGTYLYLKKNSFNDYYERRNIYALEEFEGNSIYDVDISLHYTANGGLNNNYDDLLSNYSFDTNTATIAFTFNDGTDFYPRPFPGEKPYDPTLTPYISGDSRNPFDLNNPIYGGISYPTAKNSINSIYISYSYYAESFFLDFNVVPGSVTVFLDGNEADPSLYTVDYNFGVIEFKEGVIKPKTSVDIYYRYTGLGGGNKQVTAAGGIIYENGPLYIHNLTAYKYPIKSEEAPEVGAEAATTLINSSQLEFGFGVKEDEKGPYASLKTEAAFSSTNPNVNNSAIVADMESEDTELKLDMADDSWMLATLSTILTLNGINLQTRGKLFYKNYWESNAITGDHLHALDWNIPSDQIFNYTKKAGPYNTADKPTGGEEKSLVLDFSMSKGNSNPFVSVVYPIANMDLSSYERFNILAEAVDLSAGPVEVYIELLSNYNEDLNGNSKLDGESSINDHGFSIIPVGGTTTVIGTNRDGNSNGKIDSEDINQNRELDTPSPESGVIIEQSANSYTFELSPSSQGFNLYSVSLHNLITSNKEILQIFQNAEALRITIVPDTALLSGGSLINDLSGKIVINKIWFSGSEIVNNNPDDLNVSQLSIYDNPDITGNAFSSAYPEIYDSLHGSTTYRIKTGHTEKLLDVRLINHLDPGNEVSVSRVFNSTRDFTPYSNFKMFVYLTDALQAGLTTRVTFYTSENEKMYADISSSNYKIGWNEIDISLDGTYSVKINGNSVGNMAVVGSLNILKRVSEVRFSFINNGQSAITSFDVWLDEWYLSGSKNYFDKTYYIQSVFGYRGDLLDIFTFPLISDSEIALSYEDKEGWIAGESDIKNKTYSVDLKSRLLKVFSTGLSLSREDTDELRNMENVKSNFEEGGYSITQKHFVEFNSNSKYLPRLYHYFDRIVESNNSIVLTKDDFNLENNRSFRESIGIGEWWDLPFGLSQSYNYSRGWDYTREKLGTPANFDAQVPDQSVSLDQLHYLSLSYLSNFQNITISLKRDDNYTGLYPYDYSSWGNSYIFKLKTLLNSPKSTLKNAILYSRIDNAQLSYSIPLQKRFGINSSISANIIQDNYIYDESSRNFNTDNQFSISFPFYPLKDKNLQVTVGLYRELVAEYERVLFREDEGELLINSFSPLFKPPLYYMSPFDGLGRIKDYEAVDIYKGNSNIFGSSKNTLRNKYELNLDIAIGHWFIPTSVDSWISGETTRDGDSYNQTRSFGTGFAKEFNNNSNDYYLNSANLGFEYENQKNYLTKVETNTVQINILINKLKEEHKGFNIKSTVSFSSDIQKKGVKKYYLIPDNASFEPDVAEKPDEYTIKNDLTLEYLWISSNINLGLFGLAPLILNLNNKETVKMENIYTFTNRKKAEPFSNIPIRITLQHNSDYSFSENINFDAYIKLVGGLEEKVIPPYTEGNFLPSMGLEFGIGTKIFF